MALPARIWLPNNEIRAAGADARRSGTRHALVLGVLRVTRVDHGDGSKRIVLRVEGRIVGEWAAWLRRECIEQQRGSEPLVLDLSDVVYVDGTGVDMLRALPSAQVRLINCRPLIAELLRKESDP